MTSPMHLSMTSIIIQLLQCHFPRVTLTIQTTPPTFNQLPQRVIICARVPNLICAVFVGRHQIRIQRVRKEKLSKIAPRALKAFAQPPSIESHKKRKFPYFSINNLSTLIQNGMKIKKKFPKEIYTTKGKKTAAREYQENRKKRKASGTKRKDEKQ
jgi:hypothetical protein